MDAVIQATMEDMLTDGTIKALTDGIIRIQSEESEDPAEIFQKELEANKRKQRNIFAAIEEGTGAAGLARHLSELEEEEKELEESSGKN